MGQPYDWRQRGDTFGQNGWEHPHQREWPPPNHTWAWLVLLAVVGAWLTAFALIFAGRIH